MVYYRKYRPQTLSELLGQEAVTRTLTQAVKNNQLSHAYLFIGPRGLGKTSAARILAKIVNCESRVVDKAEASEGLPCNLCGSCQAVTDGSSLDYIEIDAASNRGIDDIRQLRENIKLAPTRSRKKVYVIDEVHMLTTEAFNALLKTLEEPPEHVLFVLATTEGGKIPATILSRVQKLDFVPASTEALLTLLKKVVSEEKLAAEEEALELLARRSEGSFRDCLKLLDQLASTGGEITVGRVEESFRAGKSTDVTALLEAVASQDSQKALELAVRLAESGTNLKEFIREMLVVLRTMLLIQYGAGGKTDSARLENLQSLGRQLGREKIVEVIGLLHQALEGMKVATIASLPLEVAVLEACQTQEGRGQVAGRVDLAAGGVLEAESPTMPVNAPATCQEMPAKLGKVAAQGQVFPNPAQGEPPGKDLAKILDKWQFVLDTIKPYNYSLEALLRQVKVVSCDNGDVVLEVPYTFHQRILQASRSRDLLESVLAEIIGKAVRVSAVLGTRPVRVEEVANIELAADDDVIKIAAEIFNSQ